MSAAATMTQELADAVFVRDGMAPPFFDKLAASGVNPETEDEAVAMLRIGQKLLAAERAEQVKAASTRVTGLAALEAALDQELAARYGFAAPAGPQQSAGEAEYAEKAAAALAADPTFLSAVAAFADQPA